MGDHQDDRTVGGPAIDGLWETVRQLATGFTPARPTRALHIATAIWHQCAEKCTYIYGLARRMIAQCTIWMLVTLWQYFVASVVRRIRRMIGLSTITEEDLMAIPRPEENLQRTFVGVLSSETAKKLKAMFRKNFCPEIVPLARGTELPPECRLVICCLPKNTRHMYLGDGTVFTKLITDAGSLQAMVLMITFGETMYDESIYGSVLQQGQKLYMRGRSQSSLPREQTRRGLSESVALVTVDNCPSKYQLGLMKKFVEGAFTAKE